MRKALGLPNDLRKQTSSGIVASSSAAGRLDGQAGCREPREFQTGVFAILNITGRARVNVRIDSLP